MNTVVLRRRLIYISAMVVLLIPLYFLGHPSVRSTDSQSSDSMLRQGGALAQIRTRYGLHHSDLGELDPASESARLATLGLRGVAATILWHKAEYYKQEKYFDRLSATVNQLRILQPHFIKVWEFQAHNLAWNVSVEFDDFRQRYEWVKKGIHFLIDGFKHNKSRTEMPFELGWAFGNKLGMSDERLQFRELYRDDRNFHFEIEDRTRLDPTQPAGQGPDGKPDNWRTGMLWYLECYRMVDAGSLAARSPLMFYCKAPQWQYHHAEAIQGDGYLGEEARNAWKLAGNGWYEYGQRPIRTSFGTTIFLNELSLAKDRYQEELEKFKEFCGPEYDKAYQAKLEELSPEQRQVLTADSGSLSVEEHRTAQFARESLEINPLELVKELPLSKQVQAMEMANQLKTLRQRIDHIDRYRKQINYPYWESRCEAEQDDDALLARSSMYQAEKLFDVGKLDEAIENYDKAWVSWARLFNHFPALIVDMEVDEVVEAVERYRSKFLDVDQESLPEDFPLNKFLRFRELYNDELTDPSLVDLVTEWPKRFPDRNFLDVMLSKRDAQQTIDGNVDVPQTPNEPPDLETNEIEGTQEEVAPEQNPQEVDALEDGSPDDTTPDDTTPDDTTSDDTTPDGTTPLETAPDTVTEFENPE